MIEGSLVLKGEETDLDFNLKGVDLSWGRLLMGSPLPIAGRLEGKLNLELFATDPLRNQGSIELKILEMSLQEGGTAGGFPLPALVLAKEGKEISRLQIAVERGNWEIRSFKLIGGDLEVEGDGKIYAARQFQNYRLSLRGHFQPPVGQEQKLPILTLVETEKVDGKYPFSVTGKLAKPAIRIGNFKVPI